MTRPPGPRPAEERLRRLLVMLPWLMEQREVAVSEVATRFGLTEAEVVKELELASMCGLPPFTEELIDLFIDDGSIFVGVPRLFTKPLRLNAVEAWELLAAGRVAMELPGADRSGPLGRGLAKLAAVLEDGAEGQVRIDLAVSAVNESVTEAVRDSAELRILYWSASSGSSRERLILPRQVFTDRGEWYVSADDAVSGEVRTFRIDRIESVERTGRVIEPSDQPLPSPGEWFADGSVDRVLVRLGPDARWIVERYPVEVVSDDDPDGWITVRVPVADEMWLARTLIRLGPAAEVIEPLRYRDIAAGVAASMLRRYRDS